MEMASHTHLEPQIRSSDYDIMVEIIDVSARAAAIEYAIRDVVVPAVELEKQGHEIIRMNVGDPLAFDGLPTPQHMIGAYKNALDNQNNGYGPSYGIPELREAIAKSESKKGWDCDENDIYVTHGAVSYTHLTLPTILRV